MARSFGRLLEFEKGGGYIYVPSYLLSHPDFPFKHGAIVALEVKGNDIVMSAPPWYVTMNWPEMQDAYNALPKVVQEEISRYQNAIRDTTIAGEAAKQKTPQAHRSP